MMEVPLAGSRSYPCVLHMLQWMLNMLMHVLVETTDTSYESPKQPLLDCVRLTGVFWPLRGGRHRRSPQPARRPMHRTRASSKLTPMIKVRPSASFVLLSKLLPLTGRPADTWLAQKPWQPC